jgi:hypothetical protein
MRMLIIMIVILVIGLFSVAVTDSGGEDLGNSRSSGDVLVRLNGGANVAYIGTTNTVEFWISNDVIVETIDLSFEFSIGGAYQFNPNYYGSYYVKPEGDIAANLDLHAEIAAMDDITPDTIRMGSADMFPPNLPVHSTHTLAYTMEFFIPASESNMIGGFCVKNVYSAGKWFFNDDIGIMFRPTFRGNYYIGAPPVCFDIGDIPVAPCGDVNCDGVSNVSDAVWIINYVFVGGNFPCDSDGDGIPDC